MRSTWSLEGIEEDPDYLPPRLEQFFTPCILFLLQQSNDPAPEHLLHEWILLACQTHMDPPVPDTLFLSRKLSLCLRLMTNKGILKATTLPPEDENEAADLGTPIRYAFEIRNPLDRLAAI